MRRKKTLAKNLGYPAHDDEQQHEAVALCMHKKLASRLFR